MLNKTYHEMSVMADKIRMASRVMFTCIPMLRYDVEMKQKMARIRRIRVVMEYLNTDERLFTLFSSGYFYKVPTFAADVAKFVVFVRQLF